MAPPPPRPRHRVGLLTGLLMLSLTFTTTGIVMIQRSPTTNSAAAFSVHRPKDTEEANSSVTDATVSLGMALRGPKGAAGLQHLALVASAKDLVPGGFYRFQDVASGRWLARALDTNSESSTALEKVFRVYHANAEKYGSRWLSIKGHTRMHLTRELNNKITVDRPWARGFEQWRFLAASQADAREAASSESDVARQTFTSVGVPDALAANLFYLVPIPRKTEKHTDLKISRSSDSPMGLAAKKEAQPIFWRIYRVTTCAVDDEDGCWGREVSFNEGPDVLNRLGQMMPFPIVGSPKPLKGASESEHSGTSDPFDPTRISLRTMMNWASLVGMKSVQYTDDPITLRLIDEINGLVKHNVTHCAVPRTRITPNGEYERVSGYDNQPTYRGLFKRALEAHPKARGVMFSNGDILYTPSLPQTLDKVFSFLDAKAALFAKTTRSTVKWHDRWMIVGQRTNFNVPAVWTMNASEGCNERGLPRWVADVERFASLGEKFQSNAEDYFIVSRNMFDWDTIPNFIVGGVAFDNWIVNKANEMARRGEAVVVDATKTVTAVHQNHHALDPKASHGLPKSRYNAHLAEKNGGVGTEGHTADAVVATERLGDGSITVYEKHRLLFL